MKTISLDTNIILRHLLDDVPDQVKKLDTCIEKAKKEGAPLDSVLDEFNAHLKKARVTIAHNISFDENVVQAEFIKMQMQPEI